MNKRSRINFDDIKKLQPNSEVWDTVVTGFGARRQKSEAVAYVVLYRTAEGLSRRFTIGRHNAPWTPQTARAKARLVLTAVANGKDPSAEKRAKRLGSARELSLEQPAHQLQLEKLVLPATMRVFVGFDYGAVSSYVEIESNDLRAVVKKVVKMRQNDPELSQARCTFVHMVDRLGADYDGPIVGTHLRRVFTSMHTVKDPERRNKLIQNTRLFFAIESAIKEALHNKGLT